VAIAHRKYAPTKLQRSPLLRTGRCYANVVSVSVQSRVYFSSGEKLLRGSEEIGKIDVHQPLSAHKEPTA
jgi:hypothetical protein